MSRLPLLQLRQVNLRRNGKIILDNVDMRIEPREIVTIVGPNGGGKTSLLKISLGLLDATSGHINRLNGLRIGYMPQRLHVDASLPITVERFLALTDRNQQNILRALQRVDAAGLIPSPLQSISGGEWQRVLLARALLRQPDLLVLDEPAQGVDLHGQQEMYHLLRDIRNETGCAILMVSHDLHFVMASTDRVLCLNQHVCCSGPAETVAQHPEYLALFNDGVHDDIGVYTHHHDHHHDLHGHVVDGPCCDHSHDTGDAHKSIARIKERRP